MNGTCTSSVVAAVARATAIFALPKLVPPIVLAVSKVVAVATLPVMLSDVRASVPVCWQGYC